LARLPPTKGRFAIVTKRGAEDAVDADSAATNALFADGEVVASWYLDAGINLVTIASQWRRGWWQESPITRETTKETVKTNRAGNAGTLRRTCGD